MPVPVRPLSPVRREPVPFEAGGLGARDALHLVVSLGDFQTRMTRDQDAGTILSATRLLLRRLLPFRTLAFLTVDDANEFVISNCDPESGRADIEREIDLKIDDGTFAWAIPQRRAVLAPTGSPGHTMLLHPLLTRSRVVGMFAGLLDGGQSSITETLLSVLSVILFTTAQALENSSLYRTMKATTVSKELLEQANAELRGEIAERQRAEDALRLSQQRYRAVFDNANDLIYTHDLDGRFTSVNPAAERVFGYEPGQGVGRCLFDVLTPECVETAREMIRRTVAGGTAPTSIFELEAVATDGRRIPLEVSARVIAQDGRPIGVQAIARDLSDRRRLEAELQQAQKMEAVGRLAGGVAHDFNNLLMVVMGYTDLMARHLAAGQPVDGELDQVRKATESAAALTRQLLAFSRRQVLQPRVLDLNEVVSGIHRMLRRVIREDIELIMRPAARIGRVEADPGQVEQVLMNLVVNARDAMPDGGKITIETADADREAPTTVSSGGTRWVTLAIGDTGEGMDAETQAHIFEPFFTTKASGKGTGLGLSTVYGIVQQHQGWIEVESARGRGTTFRIYLPRVEERVAPSEPSAVPAGGLGGRETVLLVEDEEPVRDLVRTILSQYGYRVVEAPDGPEAIDVFERDRATIDLLLTDVVMPQMSGRTLAQRLQAMQPRLKVLYMSGYSGDIIGHHGVLDSQLSYLQKPFPPEALARKLRELLEDAPAESSGA